jgi:hypothetical protein
MRGRITQKKIFALRPVLKLLSCVSLRVVPVLQFLALLLQLLVSFLELFNKSGSGLVVIPVLRFLILVLQTLVSFLELFKLFTKGKC